MLFKIYIGIIRYQVVKVIICKLDGKGGSGTKAYSVFASI